MVMKHNFTLHQTCICIQIDGVINKVKQMGVASCQMACKLSCQQIPSNPINVQVSPELGHAAGGADLVIFEGMGRAIETNLYAELTCDRLNLGMIKHPEVKPPQQISSEYELLKFGSKR